MRTEEYDMISDVEMTVGKGERVTVTDPCYNTEDWNQIESDLPEGRYCLFIGGDGKGVMNLMILNEKFIRYKDLDTDFEGSIGVDSGMAGFFIHKPNFREQEEWIEFLDEYVNNKSTEYLECPWGLFSHTYSGDGQYDVYGVYHGKDKAGLMIDFGNGEDDDDYY